MLASGLSGKGAEKGHPVQPISIDVTADVREPMHTCWLSCRHKLCVQGNDMAVTTRCHLLNFQHSHQECPIRLRKFSRMRIY